MSSTMSIGCMMSLRQRGISTTCSRSPTAQSAHLSALFTPSVTVLDSISRPPILIRAAAISSEPKSRPSIFSISRSGTRCLTASPRGVSVDSPSNPVTLTLSTVPPLSCSDRHTSIRHASQARSSHPVTSMKKSVVDSVTVVWSPLMMGGNDRMSSFESRMTGNVSNPSIRCAYSTPLGCSSRICFIVISSLIIRGTKECVPGTVTTLNGSDSVDRSCTPIEANLRLRPSVRWSFS